MTIIKTKDGIYLDIGDLAPDAPEVREAVMTERAGRMRRRMETPEMQEKVAATREQMRQELDPTAGMSAYEKTKANLGAGFSTALQGLRQITPGIKGPSDEEIMEKRAIDKQLAQKTDLGLGPDWAPSAGSALQFAGEMAPTLAIPAGAVGNAAARALPMAGKVLPRAVASFMGRAPVRAGMIGGGAAGAMQPVTSDESRIANTGLGAAAGAVLPLALAGGRGLYKAWGAPDRAARNLAARLGAEAETIPGQVAARDVERAGTASAARAIPESLAEATGSPVAAGLEAESARGVANPEWTAFKRAQNEARYNAVQEATNEADMLAARKESRKLTTDPLREAAMQEAGGVPIKQVMAPVQQAVAAIENSADALNPSVQQLLALAKNAMNPKATGGGQPESLAVLKHLIVKNLKGPAKLNDPLSAAVKGADVQATRLVAAIDQALDQASGGRWGPYNEAFAGASKGVDASRAAGLVRQSIDEIVPELGDAPNLTATRLAKAMKASEGGERKFPLKLSPRAQSGLEDVREHMAQANEVQSARKTAGTAGGGSQTSFDINQIIHRALSPLGGLYVRAARGLTDWVAKGSSEEAQRELAVMLQNPQVAVRAIQRAQQLNRPLSEAEGALMQALSQSAGALPQAVFAQQPR